MTFFANGCNEKIWNEKNCNDKKILFINQLLANKMNNVANISTMVHWSSSGQIHQNKNFIAC